MLSKDFLLPMQFPREHYSSPEEENLRRQMTVPQYITYLKQMSDARRNKSGFHGVGLRESGRWQARKSGLPVGSLY
jgi:hypothetical protein